MYSIIWCYYDDIVIIHGHFIPLLNPVCSLTFNYVNLFEQVPASDLFYNVLFSHQTDVDECTEDYDDCDTNAECTNTPGSFECTCNIGYTGDGVTCEGAYNNTVLTCNIHCNYCSSFVVFFGMGDI